MISLLFQVIMLLKCILNTLELNLYQGLEDNTKILKNRGQVLTLLKQLQNR